MNKKSYLCVLFMYAMAQPTTSKPVTPKDLGVYINPLTDFGFKRIFGTDANKDLLIDFLNAVLKIRGGIKDLHYAPTEKKGRTKKEPTTFYDLHCITGRGERIIVEVQTQPHKNFIERGLVYVSRAIEGQEKIGKGKKEKKSNYDIRAVYQVNIVNFSVKSKIRKTLPDKTKYTWYVRLMDEETQTVFCDKMTMVYIDLKTFNKEIDDLQNNYERWVYVFKNLPEMKNMPKALRNDVFPKLFEQAKIANMTPEEYDEYNQSLKNYRSMCIVTDELKETIAAKNKKMAAMKRNYEAKFAAMQRDNDARFASMQRDDAAKDKWIASMQNEITEYRRMLGLNGMTAISPKTTF